MNVWTDRQIDKQIDRQTDEIYEHHVYTGLAQACINNNHFIYSTDKCLLSLSNIVTVALAGSPTLKDEEMMRVKYSGVSNILSSIIETLNGALIFPAAKVTVYGPGT